MPIKLPYLLAIHYNDGSIVNTDTPLSLSMAAMFAKDLVTSNLDEIESVDVIDNYTGEVVYTIKANIRIEIDLEVYNPYNL